VGGEVLDHADVLDAVGERPDALGGDREDLAERVDVLERGEQRGVVALDVADGAADAGALDGGDDRAASSAVEASGFSTSTLAPRRSAARRRRRAPRWARRRPRSRARARRRAARRSTRAAARVAERAEAVAAGVDGAGERDARAGLQDARVVTADHPQAEDRAAQGLLAVHEGS
jgi:hypothetical protein